MNLLGKIQEIYGNILGKNIINGNLRIEIFEIFEILETLGVRFFEFLKFRIPGFLIIRNDEFLKIMKSRRRGMT